MKTQKKKTFSLNKLQIAKLEQVDFIKGKSHEASTPQNPCSDTCSFDDSKRC